MESISNHPILKFNPDVIQGVRQELNLHQPGAMEEVIESFEDWIKKQEHLIKKDFPRNYLETTLISSKGSLEKAKKSFDKLCTLKTLMPEFFQDYDVKKIPDFSHFIIPALMPKQLKDNYRVHITRILSPDFDSSDLFNFYKYCMLVVEHGKLNDYFMGMESLIDARDVNLLNLSMKVNIVHLKQLMSVMMDGYKLRIKGIYILSSSKTVDILVSILKQVVSAKVGERIRVFKSLEELHEHVPREVLPKDYGGDEKPLKDIYYGWRDLLGTESVVNCLKEICRPGTNEAFRRTDKYNEEVLGMPGSFRSLTVD